MKLPMQIAIKVRRILGMPSAVADLEGGGAQEAPRKIVSTMGFFLIPFCIKMLKYKAQIARECIKKTESFQST